MAVLSAKRSRAGLGAIFHFRTRSAAGLASASQRASVLAGALFTALGLSACHQPASAVAAEAAPPQTAESPQAVPLMSAPCVKAVPTPYKWEGYNDKPRDACLGPVHFRIPANLFRDQMGPDFQGNFVLVVMWPDLQGAAPGKLNGQPMDQVMARVQINPDYVDRVPVEGLLERFIAPSESQLRERDPAHMLELRDRLPERFGLTPYFVNPKLFDAFEATQLQRLGYKSRAKLENMDDWYLHRDAEGRLTTLIRCGSHLKTDGYAVRGRTLVKDPQARINAQCSHDFVIPDIKTHVQIDYSRALLGDWKRFEDRARELLDQYRVR